MNETEMRDAERRRLRSRRAAHIREKGSAEYRQMRQKQVRTHAYDKTETKRIRHGKTPENMMQTARGESGGGSASAQGVRWLLTLVLVLFAAAAAFLFQKKMTEAGTGFAVAEQTAYQVITDSCNVRAGAGTNYKVVGHAEKKDVLPSAGRAVLNSTGSYWYEVYLEDGSVGWVSESVVMERWKEGV